MATNRIGTVALMLTANAQGVAKGVNDATKSVSGLFSGVSQFASRSAAVFTGYLSARAFSAAVEGAKDLAKWAAQTAMEYEQAEIAFQVMTGSKAGGTKLLNELQQLAVETPFKSSEVVAQAKLLKAYGVETEDLIKTISQLGDVAAGTGVDIGRLSLAYGQVISKGRFQASELRQFTEAGAGVAMFAKAANMSTTQFLAAMEQGKIGSDIVVKAFEQATMKGGMFFRLMEKQSQTVKGRFDSFIESLEIMVGKVGLAAFKAFEASQFFDGLAKAVQGVRVQELSEWFKKAADGLSPLYHGMLGMIESAGELARTAFGLTAPWGEFKKLFEEFVDAAIPAMHQLAKAITSIGIAALNAMASFALPGTEKLMKGSNRLAEMMRKDQEELATLSKKYDDRGFFGNLFDQGAAGEDMARIKELTFRIEKAKEGIAVIGKALDGIDQDARLRSKLTGGLSDIIPNKEELQSRVMGLSEMLNGFDRGTDAAQKRIKELRAGGTGGPSDARAGVMGGLLFGGMKADEMAEEAAAAARIAGERFEKSFMQGAELIAPGFKKMMDGVVADSQTAGEQLRQSMEAIALGEAVQRIGAGAADRQRVAAFEAFKKATGVGEIRNTAPLLETGSQAAYSALNAARGVGAGSTVEDIIRQGNAIAEQTAKNTAETARELKNAFKPNPVSTILAIKFGGG